MSKDNRSVPIDPTSHVPIYEQIVEHIQVTVAAGIYRPGQALPSTRALAVQMLVNPNTVQRAYQQLERQGVVRARKGLGIFVAENGPIAAMQESEAAMRERFLEGVHLGRTAGISTRRIRTSFGQALTDPDSNNTQSTDTDEGSAP